MNRKLIVGLVVALVFGSVVTAGHATAKKRKPVSFKAEGSILLSNPNDLDVVGRQESDGTAVGPASLAFEGGDGLHGTDLRCAVSARRCRGNVRPNEQARQRYPAKWLDQGVTTLVTTDAPRRARLR